MGPDFGCYYHPEFLRGISPLAALMKRVPPRKGKLNPDAEREPNFYLIARLHPLPAPMTSYVQVSLPQVAMITDSVAMGPP